MIITNDLCKGTDVKLMYNMKKTLNLRNIAWMCVAAFMLASVPQVSYAQNKQLEKAQKKQYKSKMKEFKKEGWKLAGSSKSLEVALLEHYAKLAEQGNKEILGEVSECRSANVCKQFALSNAQNLYAAAAAGVVKGISSNLLSGDATDSSQEQDKFNAEYAKAVSADIGGALTESFAVVKENGDTKQYRVFYIVNETKAHSARQKALKQALGETKLNADIVREISKVVDEEVSVE
jgi:hypothetical protein